MNLPPPVTALMCFGVSFGVIRFLAPRAKQLGLIDVPSGERKDHVGHTPLVGGLAIVAGLSLTALLTPFASQVHAAFWIGLFMILVTGTLDDLVELNPYLKFVAQIAAALLMCYWGGLSLESLGNLVSDKPLSLGRFGLALSMFGVIGVVNAINLCDGADGLGAGLAFIAVFWIALMSAATGSIGTYELALGLLGGIAAFLAFNLRTPWRKNAAIFLGDAGSLSLGFALAWLCVAGARSSPQLFAPVTAIWLVAIPLSDTIVCMTRRLAKGKNPFRADRTHVHHILIDLGLPPGRAVALILLVAFVLAAAGVAGWALKVPEHRMFYTAMAVFALYIFLVQSGLRRAQAKREPAPA